MVIAPLNPGVHRQLVTAVDAAANVVDASGHVTHCRALAPRYLPISQAVHVSLACFNSPEYPAWHWHESGPGDALAAVVEWAVHAVHVFVPTPTL